MFKITDRYIFRKLGRQSYIRNGVGYGFISDDYLYDNKFIEIGIGRIKSSYGDWGGGFANSSDSPLKIIIDKDYKIQKIETSSFYNFKNSKKIEKISEKIKNKLKIGTKFIVKDTEFKYHIDKILNVIQFPFKSHIGHDVFESPHMLDHFTNKQKKNEYKFRNPKNN